MKNSYTIWELLGFIFGCTVCAILLVNVIGMFVLKIPSTPDNAGVRNSLIDLLKYIAGAIIGIISAKVLNKTNDK